MKRLSKICVKLSFSEEKFIYPSFLTLQLGQIPYT
jgi:hypothetical protein